MMRMRRALLTLVFCAAFVSTAAQSANPQRRTTHVVLVTLDGVRVQEMFGGLDVEVLRAGLGKDARIEDDATWQRYRASTPEARRERLMPFFWGTLMREHGSIAGDPARGSHVRIGNRHGFSYPGYAELLTGRPHDAQIASNDNVRNPFPTVLEFVRRELDLPQAAVATFASWETLNWIGEHEAGATYINAGFEAQQANDSLVGQLNALQGEAKAWNAARLDAFTAAQALAYLQRERPRLLYVSFNDTDEWAHRRDYPFTLDAIARADRFLQQLWTWLQSQPDYRDQTTLIVTTDHGRGNTPDDWSDHGEVEGAQNIWLAIASPDDARRGAWSAGPALRQGQVAATIAAAFGLDYAGQDPGAGAPIVLQSE